MFGFYLVLYYIFKKASKGLNYEERLKIINWRLRPLIFVSIVANLCVLFTLEYSIYTQPNRNVKKITDMETKTITCLSPIWILSTSFEFLAVLIFAFLVRKLNKQNKAIIEF
jgi:hypothetical protein